jgi:hypothetical protein
VDTRLFEFTQRYKQNDHVCLHQWAARKFAVTVLPKSTLAQGGTGVSGILGMDILYNCHGMIDLDNMNLFLK